MFRGAKCSLEKKTLYLTKHQMAKLLSNSTRKVFMPNPNKKQFLRKKPPEVKLKLPEPPEVKPKLAEPPGVKPKLPELPEVEPKFPKGARANKLNIQMLSSSMYKQVFRNKTSESCNLEILKDCKLSLEKHKMISKKEDYLPDIDFKLPPLLGRNIEEHFEAIGEHQLGPYRDLVLELLTVLPDKPQKWIMQPGWTRYVAGQPPESVPYPLEAAMVFDIEVCMAAGKAPTLATAVSSRAWYGWVSQSLIEGASKPVTTHQYSLDVLIPIESTQNDCGSKLNSHMKKPKVIVGHNVSYDRARIKEQYWLKRTGTRFVDTMSLHVCVSGVTSYQRAVLKGGTENEEDEQWKSCSSLNSLGEVYKLYCGKTISKATRDLFVEGTLADIKNSFQETMEYCSNDVSATYQVLQLLFPMFLERFPHPVTLAGMLELSTAYLPVNSNWNRYITNCEQSFEDLNIESRILLARRADQACQLLHDDKYREDLWLWDQDWEVKNLKLKQAVSKKRIAKKEIVLAPERDSDDEVDELEEKFSYLWKTKDLVTRINRLLPGYPNWYRKLCTLPDSSPDWVPGPHLIGASMRITPKLLALTWEGYPLHFVAGKGWGFLVPFTDEIRDRKLPLVKLLEKCPLLSAKTKEGCGSDVFPVISNLVQDDLTRKEFYSRLKAQTQNVYKGAGIWCQTEIEDCCYFFKLPHKNGASHNVGNPLAKDFLNKFSDNVLAGYTESAEQVLTIARMLSYWRNNRARVFDQMVVWLDDSCLPGGLAGEIVGAIVPQVVISGTLTRRAVEPTWMTASNAHPERVGSELRSMIQAPPGYNIVGADVDSQELWISSVIGDAHQAKTHGATPFGWMTLSGNKNEGTDMHSITAKAVGISRDHAKVINYARIYGAGQNFAEKLLKQFNPSISESDARRKATTMFALTKGKQQFRVKTELCRNFPDKIYSKWQAFEMAKANGKKIEEIFGKPRWVGGTESAMFNRLETIASDPEPRTPFLNCRLSRALEPKSMADDRYLPTRVNWVVQSGAVDFLHLMLVCMRWIMGENARFCLSFHDEIRYLVPGEHKYQAALAMHVTNLLTRAFCSGKLGIYDLPQSVAFFSSVEIDTVLRKDAEHDGKTPSNPHGLEKGYNVPYGETLDVYQAVEKAGGQKSRWYEQLKGECDY